MRRTMHAVLLLALLITSVSPGCRSSQSPPRRAHTNVEPEQFVLSADEAGRIVPPVIEPATQAQAPAHARPAPVFSVTPGSPMSVTDAAQPVQQPVLLEAKVGDINGRPVFASEFLEPLEGKLRAAAEELDLDKWIPVAAQIIRPELRALVTDELLRAEALSRLSVEQKAGLRRFLQDVRRNLISQSGGSQQRANDRLKNEQGLTEEEYLSQHEDRTLVRFTIQEEISDRVNVSWRDIVRRYRRDDEKYHPQPTAKLWVLRVDADDEQAVGMVRESLASGTPFPEIAASDVNTWTLDEHGLKTIKFVPPQSEAQFFNPPELNDPARSLAVGEWAGPIVFRSSLIWLHLESIEQDSTSLYDAQLEIAARIRSERVNENLEQYIDRLLGRSSVTDLDRMLVRLVSIATDRYGPSPSAPDLQ